MRDLLLIIGSYLIGALPFSYWVARRSSGADLMSAGSGNPGATNVLRVAGKRPAALALVLDIFKGVGPVAVAVAVGAPDMTVAAVAVAAIGGHILSPFLGLRGGKGVATATGALTVLNPSASFGGVVFFVALVVWKRYVSLGSTIAAIAIAILAVVMADKGAAGGAGALAAVIIATLVVVRHAPNFRSAGGD